MAEIASAYVSILPSARGFGRKLEGQVGGEVKKSGSKIGGLLGGALKKSAIGTGAAVAGVLTTSLVKGFSRLQGIEEATAKLEGLGHSAKDVKGIMNDALKSVKGTAFGLDQAATIAAGAVASGIQPGKELQRTLTLTADAATIAGVSLGDMGRIFQKVAASNKIQGDVIAQLNDAGIPIIQLLGKELGKTAEQTVELASQGKINFKTFQNAMERGLGGAALKSGNTVKGSFNNMMASLGRIGANFLSGVYPKFATGFRGITDLLGPIEGKAGKVGEKFARIAKIGWGKLEKGFDALKGIRDLDFSKLDGKKLGEQLGTAIATGLGAVGKVAGKITGAIGRLFGKVDWAGLGIEVGKQAPALLLGLAAGLLSDDAITNLIGAIGEHWQAVLFGVLVVAFAPAKIIGPLGRILSKIPFVGRFLAAAVRWVSELGSKLAKLGAEALKNFWRGFTEISSGGQFVTNVLRAIRELPGRLKEFWGLLKTRIGVWAIDAFEAATKGAGRAVGKLLSFVASVPGRILRALGSLLRTLSPRGADLMEGLARGALAGFGRVGKFLASVPGRILHALGSLGRLLYNSGKALIGGLAQGIKDKAADAWNAVKSIASKIKDHFPGSPVKTGPLTSWNNGGAGKRLMGLLAKGIDAGSGQVAAAAKKAAKKVGIAFSGTRGGNRHGGLKQSVLDMVQAAGASGDLSSALDGLDEAAQKAKTRGMAHFIQGVKDVIGRTVTLTDRLSALRSAFDSIKSSVTGAFSANVFGGSLGDLIGGVSRWKAQMSALLPAVKKLIGEGISGQFLQGLMSSGNTDLILALAGGPASQATGIQSMFDDASALAAELGTTVAASATAADFAALSAEVAGLRSDLRGLPGPIGRAVGSAINGAASDAARQRRRP